MSSMRCRVIRSYFLCFAKLEKANIALAAGDNQIQRMKEELGYVVPAGETISGEIT